MRRENLSLEITAQPDWNRQLISLHADGWKPLKRTVADKGLFLEAWSKQPRGPLGRFRRTQIRVIASNWDPARTVAK